MRESKIYSSRKKKINAILFVLLAGVFLVFIVMALNDEEEESKPIFTKQLPVIVIDTNNQDINVKQVSREEIIDGELVKIREDSPRFKVNLSLYNQDPFDNNFKIKPEISTDTIINTRGQSSLAYPKKQYTMRFVDDNDFENPQQVLNLPKHDKWVLNGMYSDKSLMRNHLAYKMAGQVMDYSPRTRYVEVYLKMDENASKEEQYYGVYLLTEKIEAGPNRVDIKKNNAQYKDSSFIMARDKVKENDIIIESDWKKLEEQYTIIRDDVLNPRTFFSVTHPSKDNITNKDEDIILKTVNDFEYALHSDVFRDKAKGYQNYADIDSFIKFSMINEITKNMDGGEVSTYFHKDIGGKLKAGPVWDYDMSLGNTSIKEFDDPEGLLMVDRVWFKRLFQDEYFAKRFKQVYITYRKTIWSDKNINSLIDEAFLELETAAIRNSEKWYKDNDDSFYTDVEELREFLLRRLNWLDDNIDSFKRITEDVSE